MKIDFDQLRKDAIYLTYFELFNKYNYYPLNSTTRKLIRDDMYNGIWDKWIIKGEFKVTCDEENNSLDMIYKGVIMVRIQYECSNGMVIKIIDLPFGDKSKITMPNEYNIYLRRSKINKIYEKTKKENKITKS